MQTVPVDQGLGLGSDLRRCVLHLVQTSLTRKKFKKNCRICPGRRGGTKSVSPGLKRVTLRVSIRTTSGVS